MKKTGKAKASRKKEENPKQSEFQRLQTQNLRLTRELDALGTIIVAQGELIGKIHLALQEKMLMPYEPVCNVSSRLPIKSGGPGSGFPQSSGIVGEAKKAEMKSRFTGTVKSPQPPPSPPPAYSPSSSPLQPVKTDRGMLSSGPVMFNTHRQDIEFSIRAKVQETTVGWLSKDGQWTVDPTKIARFDTKEEAMMANQKTEPPKGATAVIEQQSTY